HLCPHPGAGPGRARAGGHGRTHRRPVLPRPLQRGVARDRCNPGPPATGGAAGPAAAAHRGTLCLAAGGRPASRLAAGGAGHPSPGQRAVLATEIAPMAELWPTLLRPAWLLLLVPSVWLLWRLWRRQRRSGRWQLLLPRPFHALLLSGGDARGARSEEHTS